MTVLGSTALMVCKRHETGGFLTVDEIIPVSRVDMVVAIRGREIQSWTVSLRRSLCSSARAKFEASQRGHYQTHCGCVPQRERDD